MAIDKSPDSERYIDEAVRSGAYKSRQEAMTEAVELLKRRDKLRANVHAGIKQAEQGELLPADDVFRRLEQRAKEIEEQAAE